MYIIRSSVSPDEVKETALRFKDQIEEAGGTVERLEDLGVRRLEYEIKDERDGRYVLMVYEADPSVPDQVSRQMRLNERILRALTIVDPPKMEPPSEEESEEGAEGEAAEATEATEGETPAAEEGETSDAPESPESAAAETAAPEEEASPEPEAEPAPAEEAAEPTPEEEPAPAEETPSEPAEETPAEEPQE